MISFVIKEFEDVDYISVRGFNRLRTVLKSDRSIGVNGFVDEAIRHSRKKKTVDEDLMEMTCRIVSYQQPQSIKWRSE